MARIRHPRSAWLLLTLATLLHGCNGLSERPALVEESRVAMGSTLRVAVWTSDAAAARRAIAAVFVEFERLEEALSVWRPDSDIERLNRAAGRGPVPVSPDTRAVLAAALEAGRLTGGKFDITFGALTDVWRFDHDRDNQIPAPEQIAARLPLVDFTAVRVDEPTGTAEILRPGVRVHAGGIGKGYAVDAAARILRAAGLGDFLIQAGGDLYAAGRHGDRPWRVGLYDPRGYEGATFATIDVSDETVSTSGDYERFFLKDGVRYHHLLDPDTGQPARLCRSVSIVARSALTADWVSTGAFVLGPDEGMALIERLPDVEGVIVTADNEVRVSSGLAARVKIERAPTR